MTLVLQERDVQALLSTGAVAPSQCVEVLEQAYTALAEEQAFVLPRQRLRLGVGAGDEYFFNCIPGAVLYQAALERGLGLQLPTDLFTIDVSEWAARGYHPSP